MAGSGSALPARRSGQSLAVMEIPSPNTDEAPRFGSELTVVEVTYADENWCRVSVTRDKRGIFRVHPERWEISDLEIVGEAYWNSFGDIGSLTDDLEIARVLAADALRKITRSTVDHDG